MKLLKLTGFILNRKPFGEFDRTLSVFSHEYGLVRVMAKGIRKIHSARSFHTDLFNHVRMEIEQSGNGERIANYLREISTLKNHTTMKQSPKLFSSACLIAAFLLRTLPHDSQQKEIFELTEKTFQSLNRKEEIEIKEILQNYFLKTIKQMGYMPNTVPREQMREMLWKTLRDLDPQLTLQARLTLGIFSNFDSTSSS